MISFFFKDADNFLPQMRAALQKGDLAEVGRLGHRLKGTVAHVGAEAAREAALRVERFMLYAGEQTEAEEAVRAFERECEVLRAALTEYQATTSPVARRQVVASGCLVKSSVFRDASEFHPLMKHGDGPKKPYV